MNDLVVYQRPPVYVPTPDELTYYEFVVKTAMRSPAYRGKDMNDADAMMIVLKGAELGINATDALTQIYIVNGKPSISVNLMTALALRSGLVEELVIPDTHEVKKGGVATVSVKRKGLKTPITASFSMEDAQQASLTGKGTWKSYAEQMLINRALAIVLRKAFSDILLGLYPPDELDPNIEINPDTGEPTTIPTITVSKPQEETPPKSVWANEATVREVGKGVKEATGIEGLTPSMISEKLGFNFNNYPLWNSTFSSAEDAIEQVSIMFDAPVEGEVNEIPDPTGDKSSDEVVRLNALNFVNSFFYDVHESRIPDTTGLSTAQAYEVIKRVAVAEEWPVLLKHATYKKTATGGGYMLYKHIAYPNGVTDFGPEVKGRGSRKSGRDRLRDMNFFTFVDKLEENKEVELPYTFVADVTMKEGNEGSYPVIQTLQFMDNKGNLLSKDEDAIPF